MLFLLAASAGSVAAHGGATIDKDPCVQKMGGWSVHFTVYEPQFNPGDEYCVDVPKAGPVIVVFDLVDQELRKTAFELEIVKTSGEARETVHHVAPKVYSTGVINAEATIASPGRYGRFSRRRANRPSSFRSAWRWPLRSGSGSCRSCLRRRCSTTGASGARRRRRPRRMLAETSRW